MMSDVATAPAQFTPLAATQGNGSSPELSIRLIEVDP